MGKSEDWSRDAGDTATVTRKPDHFFDEALLDETYQLNNNQKFHLNRVFITVFKKQIVSFLISTALAAVFLISSFAWTGMIQALGVLIMGSYLNYYYSKDKIFRGYLRGNVVMEFASSFVREINLSMNIVIAGILLSLILNLISVSWLGISLAAAIWTFGIWRLISIFFKVKTIEGNIEVIAPWV